jgi:type I restriction enzyme S subunit
MWKECKLGDLLEVKHGFAFLGEHFSNQGSHIVLTPGNFFEDGGFKRKEDNDKWYRGPIPSEYILGKGDLVVAMTEQAEGLLGSAAIIPASDLYLHNQRIGLVLPKDAGSIDKAYAYYLFNSRPVRQQIRASASGTKIRHTAPSRITDVEINLPPLPLQNRIAGILSAYDDLIENSQRRIKILEEMARRLYREWFVTSECVFTWPEVELGSMLELKRGYDLPERARRPGDVPIISSSGFTGSHDSAMAKGPGLVTGRYGTLGQVFLVWDDFWPLNTALYVKDFRETPVLYAYWLLRHALVNQSGSAAAVPGLNRNHLHALKIAAPPASEMQRFHDFVEPLANQARLLEHAIQNLRRTRDLLHPRLLSGKIDVEALPEPALQEVS